jgi:phosphate transport system permease protein
MLRAVSVFVLGAVAFGIVSSMSGVAPGSILSQLVSGVAYDQNGLAHPGTGSFVLASGVLALLVIPVIAKQTQEGLRSVPREIREGSVALGATEGYGLRRILLPWAGLNILTGLLLGAAEASGGLAAIVLIAGLGSDGVGPTNTVTSLDYALFSTLYGYHPYVQAMQAYRYTTALLLLALTLGLAVLALVARRRVGRRYRGGLTAE